MRSAMQPPLVIAVTVLTSIDQTRRSPQTGVAGPASAQVERLALLAQAAGAGRRGGFTPGSFAAAGALRPCVSRSSRPASAAAGDDTGDQRRTAHAVRRAVRRRQLRGRRPADHRRARPARRRRTDRGGMPRGDGRRPLMVRLTLYSRPGCHLCEEMKATVDRVATSVPLQVDEIDVSTERRPRTSVRARDSRVAGRTGRRRPNTG